MDRRKKEELPKMQVGFIDFICMTLYEVKRFERSIQFLTGQFARAQNSDLSRFQSVNRAGWFLVSLAPRCIPDTTFSAHVWNDCRVISLRAF